ncbi:MAG: cytochrome c peroxidase [Geminicoccales bacterium]
MAACLIWPTGAVVQVAEPAIEEPFSPVPDSAFRSFHMPVIKLGWLLDDDRIVSGTRNVACATCHHPALSTSDEVSLSFGDGGEGLGPARELVAGDNQPEQRGGRHSPAVFNLGATEFQMLFHDG